MYNETGYKKEATMKEGKMIKRIVRKPLITEGMSTEEKNERFYEALRRLTKRR